jgi:hypothetical protein
LIRKLLRPAEEAPGWLIWLLTTSSRCAPFVSGIRKYKYCQEDVSSHEEEKEEEEEEEEEEEGFEALISIGCKEN